MHHHHHHHIPHYHHHHIPHHHHHHHRPPPPPPPPPPPEAFLTEEETGPARCYFCGTRILQERDVRKTEYHVGHGHKMFVMICPTCTKKKERGKGPFQMEINPGPIIGILLFVAIVIFGYFFIVKPMDDKHKRFQEQIQQRHQEFQKQMEKEQQEFKKRNGFGNWP